MARVTPMNPVTGLALGRIAVGAVSFFSPDQAARLFRLDPTTNPQLPYMSRMFGSREIALGAITLMTTGAARRRLVQLGVAVDGADTVAALLAARGGYVSKATGALLALPALGAVAVGVSDLTDAG